MIKVGFKKVLSNKIKDADYSSSYDSVESVPVDFIPDTPKNIIPTNVDNEIFEENFNFSSEVDEFLDDLLAGTDFFEHDLIPEFILATAVSLFSVSTSIYFN